MSGVEILFASAAALSAVSAIGQAQQLRAAGEQQQAMGNLQAQIIEQQAALQAQAIEQQTAAEADILTREAARESLVSEAEAGQFGRDTSRLMARQRVLAGASGVQVGTGTPLSLAADTAAEAEFQRQMILSGGKATTEKLLSQAGLTRTGGQTQATLERFGGATDAVLARAGGEAARTRARGQARTALVSGATNTALILGSAKFGA